MKTQLIDFKALGESAPTFGPQWGTATDDLNATLLSWPQNHEIASHANNEVDVIWIAVSGKAEVVVDGETLLLQEGCTLIIPKGCQRSLRALSPFRYLSIHRRRAGLQIGDNTK